MGGRSDMLPADLDPAELVALGRAVRELRARRQLSQEALGWRGDLHRNYVGAVEHGEVNPTFRVLLKLGRGLSVPLSELIYFFERHRRAGAWPDACAAGTVAPTARRARGSRPATAPDRRGRGRLRLSGGAPFRPPGDPPAEPFRLGEAGSRRSRERDGPLGSRSPMAPRETDQPPERKIVLTPSAWAHICRRHPELATFRDDILRAVNAPEVTMRDDRHAARWRFYRSDAGPSRWLAVVVDFDEDPARIVTAHGFRKEHPR